MSDPLTIAVIGAGGYTGGEILRLLGAHPRARIDVLTAKSKAGCSLLDIHPHLTQGNWPPLSLLEQVDLSEIDCIFCCLPHTTSQEVIASLPDHSRVIDLSADFRLREPETYQTWYGCPHKLPHLLPQAVYGLSEWARADLPTAKLVANPGCYATACLLALRPLVEQGLIEPDSIIISAASGVSGAGREARENLLLSEAGESMQAYSPGGHRHLAEIEQELAIVAPHIPPRSKKEAKSDPLPANAVCPVTFIPHLAPMTRGILATIIVTMTQSYHADDLRSTWSRAYADSPFIHILAKDRLPTTKALRGSNACHLAVSHDRVPQRAILLAAIDNLVKGAAGQAIQNMNLMFGLPETTGLPVFGLRP